MTRRPIALLCLPLLLLMLSACQEDQPAEQTTAESGAGTPVETRADAETSVQDAGEITLYSARQENLIKPLLDAFTDETGIRINLLTGSADALLQRLESEGLESPADVLITTDAGRLHRAQEAGVLQPITDESIVDQIPAAYRHPDLYWVGLSLRARPIMYVTDRVDPAELSSYESLADPKWRQRICIRSSGNIYNQSLVASMIAAHGEAEVEQWATGLVANLARKPTGGDRDQIKAAANGQCDLVVANTYYLAGMLESEDADQVEAASKMAVFWPNQSDRGVHVNISGIGLTRSSSNPVQAEQLIAWLLSEKAQALYGSANGEYPVRSGVPPSALLASWGEFVSDDLNLSQLGVLNAQAVKLMDRAGWQ